LSTAFSRFLLSIFGPKTPTNADRIIGCRGLVLEPIDRLQSTGRVNVDGMNWKARSYSTEPIAAGRTVEIIAIEGASLVVREIGK
jgi:membrane protein implicated in regulation of membrane protease activity